MVLVLCVEGYRRFLSPLKPRCCRYMPTCSEYAIQALRMHGAVRGTVLALLRILRCHPFWHGDMYDPVPLKFAGSEYKSKDKVSGSSDCSKMEKADEH